MPLKTAIVLCFINIVNICYGREEPYFTKSPQNADVNQGKSITLPCEVVPNQGIRYYWELNGGKLTNTTRRHQQDANLHITRVDRERDSGQFTCVAEDSTGTSITSSSASLNIQWIGETSVQLQEPESASFIQRGNDVILRCHLDASGDIRYEWFRNAERLVKSSRLEIKKKRLHIKAVEPQDNGIYRCTAKNEAGIQSSEKNFALAVAGDQTPSIQIVPMNQIARRGSTAYFDCVYEKADDTQWFFKENGPLETNKKIVIHDNKTLQINDVQESDQGLYNCVGSRSDSPNISQSYTVELKLAYINELSSSAFEPLIADVKQILPEGSSFQLSCLEPDSLPQAKKWWLNPNGHTISDAGEVRVDDDGRLILDNIKSINAGNYTCVAENIAGKTTRYVELIATTKPVIIAPPKSITVNENDQSMLICKYETNSEFYTVIKWKKDGKYMKHDYNDQSSRFQRIKIFKNNGTLIIYATQIADRGEYICEVSTIGFEPVISKPATISIIETLKFSPPPVNKKLELGSIGKVHCKAQGTPPPMISWEKNGISSEHFASHISDTNGSLHFNGVLAEDKGKYICIAANSQGVINVTVFIDVVVSPKFSVVPKNPTEAIEGQPVIIDCVVEGDPTPTIHWDKNLVMNGFEQSRFLVLPNGSLFISEVRKDDENKYGCTAGSSAGLNRKETQLIVHSAEDSTVTKAVLITMSVAGAYIILVVGLMVWCRYRRRSRKLPVIEGSKVENGDLEHTELRDDVNTQGVSSSKPEANGIETQKDGQKSDGAETTHSQSSSQSRKSKSSYDKLTLPRSQLKDVKLIGRGEFGDVMIGKIPKSALIAPDKRNSASNGSTDDKDVHVLIKALTNTKDETVLTEFKREIDIFLKLSHENITKLHGLCRELEPHYMILEHTDWGDLKQFMVATQKGNTPPLTTIQCVAIIHQIARGLECMSSLRIIHRDLAARNCLVTSSLVVKIGLPRLTRDPYSQEYCKHLNQIIPLRWLPYEAVYEDEYSSKSDVYAFAVVILEIFSQGELPFPKINDNSFLSKLKEKKLEWKSHAATPTSLQTLQNSCWEMNPQSRPPFSDIAKEVSEILKTM